jgi:S-DNA-T family DNA segregation ATPase FtsK/SpoIIIE
VLSANQEWQVFIDAFCSMISECYGIKTMVFAPAGKSIVQSGNEKMQVVNDIDGSVNAVRDIFSLVLTRNNDYKDKLAANEATPDFEPVFVVIQSMSLLKTMLERYKPSDDEIKEADDDTPLHRLQLAMWKCDKAYNIHFVVAEGMNSLNPFTVEDWYKTHINGSNGIWVGSGISTQFRLTVNKKPQDYHADIESDFGFTVNNATAISVKLLQ